MSSTQKTILIVNTNEEQTTILVRNLQALGFQTITCQQGIDGCSHINNSKVAGVISAAKVGGMKAGVLYTALSNSKNKATPMIIFSEEKDEQISEQIAKNPYTTYLVGPFQPLEIQKALNILITVCENANNEGTGITYDVRMINAYIAASKQVIDHYCGDSLKIEKPLVKKDTKSTAEVTSLISITGERLKGSIAISMPRELFIFLRNKMTFQFKDNYKDEEINDTAGELANQICGSLKRNLASLGFKTVISLPKVILGTDYQIDHLSKSPVLLLPVQLDQHKGSIEFCFQKSNDTVEPEPDKSNENASAGDIILF